MSHLKKTQRLNIEYLTHNLKSLYSQLMKLSFWTTSLDQGFDRGIQCFLEILFFLWLEDPAIKLKLNLQK